MYWATSFCEREHSSKRAWMYFDRLWCSLVPPSGETALTDSTSLVGRSGVFVAARFIGGSVRRIQLALLLLFARITMIRHWVGDVHELDEDRHCRRWRLRTCSRPPAAARPRDRRVRGQPVRRWARQHEPGGD